MSDLGTLIDGLKAEVDTINEKTEPNLRRSIARALTKVRVWRTLLNEASYYFTTTALYSAYSRSAVDVDGASLTGDFPRDIVEIRSVVNYFSLTGRDAGIQLRKVDIRDIRAMTGARTQSSETNSGSGGYPNYFAWYNGELHLGPTPSKQFNIAMDYISDPRYATDGTLFSSIDPDSSDSDGLTNVWFTKGEPAIRALVLRDYYMHTSKDAKAAGMASQEVAEVKQSLEREWVLHNPLGRSEMNWGGGDDLERLRQEWW